MGQIRAGVNCGGPRTGQPYQPTAAMLKCRLSVAKPTQLQEEFKDWNKMLKEKKRQCNLSKASLQPTWTSGLCLMTPIPFPNVVPEKRDLKVIKFKLP